MAPINSLRVPLSRLAAFIPVLFFYLAAISHSQAADSTPSELATTPPMGWNSYDAYGSSVTEDEIIANAAVMKDKLLHQGWDIIVIDYRWSDADAAKHDRNGIGGPLTMDRNGRLQPAPNRFPSAADGSGFKPLADRVHDMGLRFGIHIMRGIPRQAVEKNTPIEGSPFHAADAADTKSTCKWCRDMYGVDASKQAGQDYYDSLFRLYASWGLDFVKVDDLSQPYRDLEIEGVRKAIDKCGRSIVFSTSPGETPVDKADHISAHANMWRVSGDFWDNWKSLYHAFDLAEKWQSVGGPGHWPDADMIPFGKLSLGHRSVGGERLSKFTPDEQRTLMTLWCLMPSPLMLGGNLAEYPAETLSLITNTEVLAVNQDSLKKKGQLIKKNGCTEIWAKELVDGSKAVGVFNRGDRPAEETVSLRDLGLQGSGKVRDLWLRKDLAAVKTNYSCTLPPHGSELLKIQAAHP